MMSHGTGQEDESMDRGARQWQHAFGWLAPDERERWWSAVVGLSALAVRAYVHVVVLQKRNMANYPELLEADAKLRVMPRLLSNGCRVTKEICALLYAGYPMGAMGRWRTLHEITVMTSLIGASEGTVAEKYEAHSVIQECKKIGRLVSDGKKEGQSLPPQFLEYYERLKEERGKLILKYGKDFKDDYGWAQPQVPKRGKRGPGITDIEKAVGLSHMRQIYAEASRQIHSNPHSVPWDLNPGAGEDLDQLFGPSTDGLSLPGILTAYSMQTLLTEWILLNDTGNRFLRLPIARTS